MSRLRLIRASAGTGKTHALSGRLLALYASGVAPETVLATTFTREAAGQIRQRVFARLLDAGDDLVAREALAADLRRAPGGPVAPLDAAGCRALLARLARRVDALAIGTLDSHVGELARRRRASLGLPPGWQIATEAEDEVLRAEAIGAAIASASSLELMPLFSALQGGAGRSPHATLLAHLGTGLAACLESEPAAWRPFRAPPALDEAALLGLAGRLCELDVPLTKAGTPNRNWARAKAALLEGLERGDAEDLLDETLLTRVLAGTGKYGSESIGAHWQAVLLDLGRHVRHVVLSQRLAASAAERELLDRFDRAYRALQRERRALRFDDLPRAALARLTTDELALPGIEHVLFDEFQDTSVLQWRLFAPLVRRLGASVHGSVFVVGDSKQAIYGWRGGESRLLESLPETCGLVFDSEPFVHSRRSSRVVIETVNRVFEGLSPRQPGQDEVDPRLEGAIELWKRRFDRHETVHVDAPGAAYLIEAADKDALRSRIVERVRDVLEQAPTVSIGVLVSRRETIAGLIYDLRRAGVRAAEVGGNPLTDAESVLLALSLLQLADHPGDKAARFHLETSPLAAALADTLAPGGPLRLRRELLDHGYGATLHRLQPHVAAAYGAESWEASRFAQLVDLGLAWDERGDRRPMDFVRHARTERVEDPTGAAVRVLTIHGAKGLEFDAVVLGDIDLNWFQRGPDHFTRRDGAAGRLSAVFPKAPEAVCRLHADLAELAQEGWMRHLDDRLCALYVALTRARRRLDVVVSARATFPSASKLVRHALAQDGAAGPDGVIWSHPDNREDWHAGLGAAAVPASAAEPTGPIALLPSKGRRAWPRRAPSADVAPAAARLLGAGDDRARRRGLSFHRWLQEVEWVEDFAAGDEELLTLVSEHGNAAELREWLTGFRALLEKPAVRAALSRRSAELWRERRFALRLEGELVVGAFDRVVLGKDEAEILDLKTDALADIEHHRAQMELYRRALAALTGRPESSICCRLLFAGTGDLHQV